MIRLRVKLPYFCQTVCWMSLAEFLVDAVTSRMMQLEQEMKLIEKQVESHLKLDVVGVSAIDILILKHEIWKHVHTMLSAYREGIKDQESKIRVFKQLVGCHIAVVTTQKDVFLGTIVAIEEIQQKIFKLTGRNEECRDFFAAVRGETPEELLNYLSLFFPYRFVLQIVSDPTHFSNIMKAIVKFRVDSDEKKNELLFQQVLKDVYRAISKTHKDPTLVLALAEIIATFFLRNTMRHNLVGFIDNFEVAESARILSASKFASLGLSEDYVAKVAAKYSPPQSPQHLPFDPIIASLQITYTYDDDNESVFPFFRHIVLELRKLTTQASVVMMFQVVLNVMSILSSVLSVDSHTVGADESFQFLVAIVSDAKITEYPVMLHFLEAYMPADIRTSKMKFFLTELKAVLDFVKTRRIEASLVLFPFKAHQLHGLVAIDEEPVELRGFVTFATPTFISSAYPEVLCYTGKPTDVAKAYKFESQVPVETDVEYQLTATSHGVITRLDPIDAREHRLIKIDVPESQRAPNDIALFSNLLLMCQHRLTSYKLSMLPTLLEMFAVTWKRPKSKKAHDTSVFRIVAEMQRALVTRGLLGADYCVDGHIDPQMVEVIKTLIRFRPGEFFIDPKVRAFICR